MQTEGHSQQNACPHPSKNGPAWWEANCLRGERVGKGAVSREATTVPMSAPFSRALRPAPTRPYRLGRTARAFNPAIRSRIVQMHRPQDLRWPAALDRRGCSGCTLGRVHGPAFTAKVKGFEAYDGACHPRHPGRHGARPSSSPSSSAR